MTDIERDAPGSHASLRPGFPRGVQLLHDPQRNKGTAFTDAEREVLGLRGLLPPRSLTQELQAERIMSNLRAKPNDLERHLHLAGVHDRNEMLYYRVVLDNLEESQRAAFRGGWCTTAHCEIQRLNAIGATNLRLACIAASYPDRFARRRI